MSSIDGIFTTCSMSTFRSSDDTALVIVNKIYSQL